MREARLDVDARRLRYRYQPQPDPLLAAQRAAYLAGEAVPDTAPKTEREDATIGNEKLLRGIPAVGRVGGTIHGTRPGDDAQRLERDEVFLRSRGAASNAPDFVAYLLAGMTEDDAVSYLADTYGMRHRNIRRALNNVQDRNLVELATLPPERRRLRRIRILERDGYTCHICSAVVTSKTAHIDHLVPRSLGGTDDPSNLATSCASCNLRRGNGPIPSSSRHA